MQRQGFSQIATLAVLVVALGYLAWLGWGLLPGQSASQVGFDGERALLLARAQCEAGPRPAGSAADWALGDTIAEVLTQAGWKIAVQDYAVDNLQLRNIVAMAGNSGPLLVIATHYDSSRGGGAGETALLLELARSLDIKKLDHRVWLLFLDGETAPNWPETSGAPNFIAVRHPAAVIYLNQLGGGEPIRQVADANKLLQRHLWSDARRLHSEDWFVDELGQSENDAMTVFVQAGIPAVKLTQSSAADACDTLQEAPLQAVGTLLESYLENNHFLSIATSLAGE
jgi:hypothetical protein